MSDFLTVVAAVMSAPFPLLLFGLVLGSVAWVAWTERRR